MLKSVVPKVIEKVGDYYYVQIWLCGDPEHKPPHVKLVPVVENSLEDDSKLSCELVAEILQTIKTGEKKIGDMFCISESFRPEVEKLLPKVNLFA
jgi:hypothetical protein